MSKNKKRGKYDRLYIFEKPLPRLIQICKINPKFYKNKTYIKKTLSVQILFTGIVVKMDQNFFAKIMPSAFFCSRLSKEL